MKVIVASTCSNDPEIHRDGCADVKRGLRSGKYQHAERIEVDHVSDAARWFWADFLPGGCAYEESYYYPDAPEGKRGMQDVDAQGYTRYLPCTRGL